MPELNHKHRWGHLRGRPWKYLDCSRPYIEDKDQ